MNIQGIINNYKNYGVFVKNVQNFKGSVVNFPEIPNDSFEHKATGEKSGEIKKAKETIVGKKAFEYYLASTNVTDFEDKLLCNEDDIDDIVVVFHDDKALPLAQAKEMLKGLEDGEYLKISNMPLSYDKNSLLIPQDWESGEVKIIKKGGQFFIRNIDDSCKVGFVRKSKMDEMLEYNKTFLETLPQYVAECYLKTYYKDVKHHLEANKRVALGDMNDLINFQHVLILPTNKNGYVAFMPAVQKGIASLKDGESVIVGRYSKDDENNDENKINVPDDLVSNTISRKHLIFENIKGMLYVTDNSKCGTLISGINEPVLNCW